jgi:hypothetical protein
VAPVATETIHHGTERPFVLDVERPGVLSQLGRFLQNLKGELLVSRSNQRGLILQSVGTCRDLLRGLEG